jgi:outer membrane protein assembly factor BamA
VSLAFAWGAAAQTPSPPDSAVAGFAPVAAETDTTDVKRFGFTLLPAIFYTPETGFAGGASVLLFFRGKGASDETRPSTVAPTLIFTAKSQIIAVMGYELNLARERYQVTGGVGYLKFPDLFYGIGSDTPEGNEEEYTPRTVFFSASGLKRMRSRFNLGVHYEYGRSEISDTEPGGLLDSGIIPGSDGGVVSGVGPVATWDSRDNLFYASTGSFHTVSATFFDGALGSDFTFERYVIDVRTYFSLWRGHVLALQAVGSFINGTPPFQSMSQIGGSELMRGYYSGRYRDRHAIALQAEWRKRVWWRLGLAAFVGAGDVAPSLSAFEIGEFKPAAGAGLRFLIDRTEGISIRVDFGFIGGTPGPYITINEAF